MTFRIRGTNLLIRSRGKLPHWEKEDGVYFITFRLDGTLPKEIIEKLIRWKKMELQIFQKLQKKELEEKESLINLQYIQKIEDYVENPVKAGLCRDWKEWPWSGLRWE